MSTETVATLRTADEDDLDVTNVVQTTMEYVFNDPNLLLRALTLPTAQEDYELNYRSLEYIGDGKQYQTTLMIAI